MRVRRASPVFDVPGDMAGAATASEAHGGTVVRNEVVLCSGVRGRGLVQLISFGRCLAVDDVHC